MNPVVGQGSGDVALFSHADVAFEEGLSLAELREKITALNNPQIILWYFGPYGLKVPCMDFYREEILQVLSRENQPTAWLYDLTAWGAFKNPKVTIDKSTSKVAQIEKFRIQSLKCIKSCEILKAMRDIESPEYFRDRLQAHTFLSAPSEAFEENRRTIGDIFQKNCPVLEPFYDIDTAKAYSVVQYLETFFIIEKILAHRLEVEQECIEIVFALPNDETKYYQDGKGSFQEDLNHFLHEKFGDALHEKRIRVQFLCFDYGDDPSNRPYNAPGKVVRKITRPGQVMPL